MSRVAILILSLVLALFFYGLGFHFEAMLIVGVGMFFEGLFWLSLLRRDRPRER